MKNGGYLVGWVKSGVFEGRTGWGWWRGPQSGAEVVMVGMP